MNEHGGHRGLLQPPPFHPRPSMRRRRRRWLRRLARGALAGVQFVALAVGAAVFVLGLYWGLGAVLP